MLHLSSYECKHWSWSTPVLSADIMCPVDTRRVAVRGHSHLLAQSWSCPTPTREGWATCARIPAPNLPTQNFICFIDNQRLLWNFFGGCLIGCWRLFDFGGCWIFCSYCKKILLRLCCSWWEVAFALDFFASSFFSFLTKIWKCCGCLICRWVRNAHFEAAAFFNVGA